MNAALVAAMLAAGCSANSTAPSDTGAAGNEGELTSEDFYYVYATDVKSLDYVCSFSHSDSQVFTNFVDALVETDPYGNYIPCLAESVTKNADATEWTFKLKPGIKWVTNSGEHYADLKAQDFVTGLQHATEFESQMLPLVQTLIVGLNDYATGLTTDFSTVGVEAKDDMTVVYKLNKPCSYFDTMCNYGLLMPINSEFLESLGEGCKLGAPDKQTCRFGDASDASSILYNGGYILAASDAKSKQVFVKNNDYWDAEHVYINKVTNVYIDGSDPSATVTGFMQKDNPFAQAALLATSDNFEEYLEEFKDIRFTGEQATTSFGATFNFNRTNYGHTAKETDKQKADTKAAIKNKDFRLAFRAAMNRVAQLETLVDKSIATKAIRNMEVPYGYVKTSDGTLYGDLVAEKSEFKVDYHEGQDPFHDKDTALAQIEKVKEALPDLDWPIHLDVMVEETDKQTVARLTSLKQSVEASTDGQIVVDLAYVDTDTFLRSAYLSTGPEDSDWDLNTSTGWGPDYADPLTYLHIFSPVDGDVTRTTLGLDLLEEGSAENNKVIEEVGFMKYQELLEEADAIVDDNDARYAKFAETEAFLLDNGLYLPGMTSVSSVNWRISRVVPFRAGYGSDKYKNVIVRKDPVSAEEYQKLRAEWMAKREGK